MYRSSRGCNLTKQVGLVPTETTPHNQTNHPPGQVKKLKMGGESRGVINRKKSIVRGIE